MAAITPSVSQYRQSESFKALHRGSQAMRFSLTKNTPDLFSLFTGRPLASPSFPAQFPLESSAKAPSIRTRARVERNRAAKATGRLIFLRVKLSYLLLRPDC